MLKININIDDITKQLKDYVQEIKEDIEKGAANLAAMTHAKVLEFAGEELHSSRKILTDNLGFEEISPGVWVVSINQDALWIEEGIEPNKDMKPDLLKENAHTSKSGSKYKAIPFEHSKAPSQLTPYAQGLVAKIKANLKKEGIPYKKVERNQDGSPRLGKLHTLNFEGGKPSAKATQDALKGVSIYQSLTKTGNVRRDILTFRTVSSGPNSEGKFIHPGYEAKKFLDKAMVWAQNEFDNNILPEILSKYK